MTDDAAGNVKAAVCISINKQNTGAGRGENKVDMKVKKEKIKNCLPGEGGWKEAEAFQDAQRARTAARLLFCALGEAGYKRERKSPAEEESGFTDRKPLSSE